VFIRLGGCNLKCSADGDAGFDCDTELLSSAKFTPEMIVAAVVRTLGKVPIRSVIITGGEPLLHDIEPLLVEFGKGVVNDGACPWVGVETNGTQRPSEAVIRALDWIACSPKTAEHTLRIQRVDELRYVRNIDQAIPCPPPRYGDAVRYLSPAFNADGSLEHGSLNHCIKLVKENPRWRLSVQLHKLIGHR
jgi:organic radical activating enzyme